MQAMRTFIQSRECIHQRHSKAFVLDHLHLHQHHALWKSYIEPLCMGHKLQWLMQLVDALAELPADLLLFHVCLPLTLPYLNIRWTAYSNVAMKLHLWNFIVRAEGRVALVTNNHLQAHNPQALLQQGHNEERSAMVAHQGSCSA